MPEKLTDAQLEATIAQQIELARSHDRAERAQSRDKAIDYYFGDMDKYVPPETNRSKTVSRDVASTIGFMLPGIIRVFSASDHMAIAEPVGIEDTQFADQATDGINYVFWKDNDGEEVLFSATWDALLHGNGIVKTFWDETPVYATSFHTGLTQDQIALLVQSDQEPSEDAGEDDDDDMTEVLAGPTEDGETTVMDQMGQPQTVPTFSIKIKRKKAPGKFVIDAIPPEEFLIDGDATKTDEAAFTDHWQRKTRSDLVQMGYDKDVVWAIPVAARVMTPEQSSRDPSANSSESTDKSMELVDYHECFIRVDADGDGEAELVRACYGGAGGAGNGKLMDWEVWEDENPFDDIKCDPVPHRWLARSIADETIDIQDVKTVLKRQLLNNIYWANNPQRFAKGKILNPDELNNPTFGGTVLGGPDAEITNLEVPMVADAALQGLTFMDEELQRRTGVSRQTMALDPEALQNQTATAVQEGKDSSYSQTELVARNMAGGWKKVFRKLLRLMVKHQDYARKVMVGGKEAVIDPRFWNADMHVSINVGLGTGSRDRDLAMLGQVLQTQFALVDRFMSAGATDDAIDMLPKIIETMTKMAESAGIRNPQDFYPEYTDQKVAQLKQMAQQRASQPDPKLQLEQAKAQADMQIQQSEMQGNQIKAQAEMQKSQADAQVKLVQAQAMARETQLQAELAQAQLQIKQLEISSKSDTEKYKADLAAATQIAAAQAKAGFEQQAAVLEAQLQSELGVQQHAQNLDLAEQAHQNALAQQAAAPTPSPAQPG